MRLFLGLLLLATPLAAQFSSAIQGTVTDATQATVPDATVTATDLATSRPFTAAGARTGRDRNRHTAGCHPRERSRCSVRPRLARAGGGLRRPGVDSVRARFSDFQGCERSADSDYWYGIC